MNHKDRVFKALDLEEPDYVPITDLALDPPIVDTVLGRKFSGRVFTMAGGSGGWDESLNYRLALMDACKNWTLMPRQPYPTTLLQQEIISPYTLTIKSMLITGAE